MPTNQILARGQRSRRLPALQRKRNITNRAVDYKNLERSERRTAGGFRFKDDRSGNFSAADRYKKHLIGERQNNGSWACSELTQSPALAAAFLLICWLSVVI